MSSQVAASQLLGSILTEPRSIGRHQASKTQAITHPKSVLQKSSIPSYGEPQKQSDSHPPCRPLGCLCTVECGRRQAACWESVPGPPSQETIPLTTFHPHPITSGGCTNASGEGSRADPKAGKRVPTARQAAVGIKPVVCGLDFGDPLPHARVLSKGVLNPRAHPLSLRFGTLCSRRGRSVVVPITNSLTVPLHG